jgi:type III restriction enzyme
MNRHVNTISNRLSLRLPQRRSLEILARVNELVRFSKDTDPGAALVTIRNEFPAVTDFERDFPSLCFALATGVGKTRLMGAFVAYLHAAHGINNFFVLAPNLTIYNKLIADFTPGTPKYVFTGLGDIFKEPPEVITGDNYESGRGVRKAQLFGEGVFINLFNISKINLDVQSSTRAKEKPRIKRLQEYIGQSYFDYLAGLPDLVLLMDESHRYRGQAGINVLNELRPILGLELTATPQTEDGRKPVPFKNVIYSYSLAQAMADGFVKEPAVATRESFNADDYSPEALERLKLEDGIRLHENTRVELEIYAHQARRPAVKPFMLIVARDTDHANALEALIKSNDFFEGRYKDKVITVHSNQRGDERDETIQELLTVERSDNKTEIVIHVNMLKEGWDVTNLYTIVPLRAADSRTLVEQSIGRGLRLPYGQRMNVAAVDRLTIVAHDRFQAIIDEARRPGSPLQNLATIYVDREIAPGRRETRTVLPRVLEAVVRPPGQVSDLAQTFPSLTPVEQQVAQATLEVLRDYERDPVRVPLAEALRTPAIQEEIAAKVAAAIPQPQDMLPGTAEPLDVSAVVTRTLDWYVKQTITMPRIVVVPTGEVSTGFHAFELDMRNIGLQPVPQDILIQHLRTAKREFLSVASLGVDEACLEDYLVRALIDFDDIDYETHAELLYKLAGQLVAHLKSYLTDEEAVRNVLLYHEKGLAALVHEQMQAHRWERAARYEVQVSRGFQILEPIAVSATEGEKVHDFQLAVAKKQDIPRMLFGGFRRCLYPVQKFSSDPERLFAVMLEREPDEQQIKWFKPARGQFKIFYAGDRTYEPDFVVETATAKYLCEPKRADEKDDEEVQKKATAAAEWCYHATQHERAHGGKPWTYLLIPHDAINDSATLKSLVARYARVANPIAGLQATP